MFTYFKLLLLKACALTHERIEDLLADTKLGRSYLKELVGVDEVKGLLKA